VTTPVAPTRQPFTPTGPVTGGIGESPRRPDGTLKVKGEFAYSSDLWAEGMLWGATVRSPHPRARIRGIDTAKALAMPGVMAVLTSEDVPGRKTYGLEIPDQPVLAWEDVRYQGEPVALVAADHPETARRAAALVAVDYEVLDPVVDPQAAMAPEAPPLHPKGNVLRHIRIRHGDQDATAEVVVTGEYEVGMQDQAFLGPESGLAVPDGEGGVDLYVSTQWLHVDRDQLAASLDLSPDQIRITLAGVGGAFGAREDLSMQIHACMLALRTGRPVKVLYTREESFFGHVHRHPARLAYEHGATRDGRLVYVKARIVLDGGAYASSSTAVCSNAACFAAGPYQVPSATIDSYVVYTDNPPCGAMRGFGAVQTCFAYESQMDRLAAELGMDPVELRRRNAMDTGSRLPTGQVVEGAAPVAELLRRIEAMPLPADRTAGSAVRSGAAGTDGPAVAGRDRPAGPEPDGPAGPGDRAAETLDLRSLPGGVSNATHGEGVRRGVGYAVGFKNIGYSEGFDDYSTARVRLSVVAGEPLVEVHTAAAEVGQGLVTVQAQIARTELAVERVVVLPADTQVGSAGSSSASRQTWMTGGAVKAACEAVRSRVLELAATKLGRPASDLRLAGGNVIARFEEPPSAAGDALTEGPAPGGGGVPGARDPGGTGTAIRAASPDPAAAVHLPLADLLAGEVIEETREYHHRETQALDPETGQGRAHVAFAFAAHRAVVDVDTELGLVKVVEIATAQDVGKAINPQAAEGQIEGGIAQGLGLALMEEIQVADGKVRNPSFTDYLIPTVLDMPPVRLDVLELGHPDSPYGLRGIGEPPTISSTPAIVAAVRAATGRPLTRVPVRPEHIVGIPGPESEDPPPAVAGRAGAPEVEAEAGNRTDPSRPDPPPDPAAHGG
jgi:CO/xanthine dehydrogenase Mo-binding subunit